MLHHASGTTPAAGVRLAAMAQPLSSTPGGFSDLPVQCPLQERAVLNNCLRIFITAGEFYTT